MNECPKCGTAGAKDTTHACMTAITPQWGEPIKGTGFMAGSPESRASWLYAEIRRFEGDVQRILGDPVSGNYREGWHPFKNEPYEFAFLRMVGKLIHDADALAPSPTPGERA